MKKIIIILEAVRKLASEFLAIILVLLIFAISPYLLRFIDPTAGSYDAGVLQILIFAVVGTLTFSFLSWIGLRINFSDMFDYLQVDLKNDFKTLTPWQKIKISALLYFAYLAVFVAMARVL